MVNGEGSFHEFDAGSGNEEDVDAVGGGAQTVECTGATYANHMQQISYIKYSMQEVAVAYKRENLH